MAGPAKKHAKKGKSPETTGEKRGDKVRAVLSYAIVGVALLYVLIVAIGYITGWRTETESTLHLAAVGTFFSGIFGVILGYYFGRQGTAAAQAAAQLAQGQLGKVHAVSGELVRSVAQLQEVAQAKADTDPRIKRLVGYGDKALNDFRELQRK